MESVHGIGAVAKALILKAHKEGKALTNEQLAERVVQIFKLHNIDVKTGAASIAWYKNDMRKKGQLPRGAMSGAKNIKFDVNDFDFDPKPKAEEEEQSAEREEQE